MKPTLPQKEKFNFIVKARKSWSKNPTAKCDIFNTVSNIKLTSVEQLLILPSTVQSV